MKNNKDVKRKKAQERLKKKLEKKLAKAVISGDWKKVVDIQFLLKHI